MAQFFKKRYYLELENQLKNEKLKTSGENLCTDQVIEISEGDEDFVTKHEDPKLVKPKEEENQSLLGLESNEVANKKSEGKKELEGKKSKSCEKNQTLDEPLQMVRNIENRNETSFIYESEYVHGNRESPHCIVILRKGKKRGDKPKLTTTNSEDSSLELPQIDATHEKTAIKRKRKKKNSYGSNSNSNKNKKTEKDVFKNGQFVIPRTGSNSSPFPMVIYQVDGRLFRKYEAFEKYGKIMYKMTNSYINRSITDYIAVEVKVIQKTNSEMIVQLLKSEP